MFAKAVFFVFFSEIWDIWNSKASRHHIIVVMITSKKLQLKAPQLPFIKVSNVSLSDYLK